MWPLAVEAENDATACRRSAVSFAKIACFAHHRRQRHLEMGRMVAQRSSSPNQANLVLSLLLPARAGVQAPGSTS
ncbi:hypothetical protein CQ14_39360 [Bradyrhizobium lablabi]|uniref:Uncharacterized protein n=1 Tax=Bradyrhizobium lablabi TaxID=722472 RepID=A0A0R3MP26_9BRAD|nr:hypothetical protein CQ14_39360 [Bradyrhizobium lablabi]